MRFTKEKTEQLNNYYQAIQHDTLLPLTIYGEKLCTKGMCICDLHDLTRLIESLEVLKGVIEDHTDVIM